MRLDCFLVGITGRHNTFWDGSRAIYYNPGDHLFYRLEDLAYQRHRIALLDAQGR